MAAGRPGRRQGWPRHDRQLDAKALVEGRRAVWGAPGSQGRSETSLLTVSGILKTGGTSRLMYIHLGDALTGTRGTVSLPALDHPLKANSSAPLRTR